VTFPYLTKVRSLYSHEVGHVVGWGVVQWPSSADVNGDGEEPTPVYLVQIAGASSSLGRACAVFSARQTEEVK